MSVRSALNGDPSCTIGIMGQPCKQRAQQHSTKGKEYDDPRATTRSLACQLEFKSGSCQTMSCSPRQGLYHTSRLALSTGVHVKRDLSSMKQAYAVPAEPLVLAGALQINPRDGIVGSALPVPRTFVHQVETVKVPDNLGMPWLARVVRYICGHTKSGISIVLFCW